MPASRPAKALRGQRNAWRPANAGTRVPRSPFPRGKRATNAPHRHTKESSFYYGACRASPTGVCSVPSAHGSKAVPKWQKMTSQKRGFMPTVGRGSSGEKHEQMQMSPWLRRPNPWLPMLLWTVTVKSDLPRNRPGSRPATTRHFCEVVGHKSIVEGAVNTPVDK